MEKGDTVIDAGDVSIAMSYRAEIMDDQGLCLQVYSEIDGKDTEILRFDCFDQAPHYHYGPENLNVRLFMDKTTAGNPLGWTLSQLRNNLPAMFERSGYDELAEKVTTKPVAIETLDQVEATARAMSRDGRRTVHHKFERQLDGDRFEAGNIAIGLEYRILSQINDEGMAIHVVSNVAGQEVELLAFDCFQNGPHYHYGPRNQDIRIYWDTTTSGETLRWTLDQFKAGNLRKMIERAGYPAIASELDENLVQSILPKIEKRAFDLVAENKAAQAKPNDEKKTKAQLIQEIESLRDQVAAL
ncbi:MAG: hypothetical protein BZY75_00640 [SAR202 cluster bacterium Io17-Chloro-G7]|nr:MAG: hypothetical protein BZY75_00640 [SAR202 cluster bacterium Io17-Chloro-G7]